MAGNGFGGENMVDTGWTSFIRYFNLLLLLISMFAVYSWLPHSIFCLTESGQNGLLTITTSPSHYSSRDLPLLTGSSSTSSSGNIYTGASLNTPGNAVGGSVSILAGYSLSVNALDAGGSIDVRAGNGGIDADG